MVRLVFFIIHYVSLVILFGNVCHYRHKASINIYNQENMNQVVFLVDLILQIRRANFISQVPWDV